jgi:hypothetical protein
LSNTRQASGSYQITEKVEKRGVGLGRWGLPGRIDNTDVGFSCLGDWAVVVSGNSEGWMMLGGGADFGDGEVFWP